MGQAHKAAGVYQLDHAACLIRHARTQHGAYCMLRCRGQPTILAWGLSTWRSTLSWWRLCCSAGLSAQGGYATMHAGIVRLAQVLPG